MTDLVLKKFYSDQAVVVVEAVEASLDKTAHAVPSFDDAVTGFDAHEIG